jgi:excisionase family DNA binding protein
MSTDPIIAMIEALTDDQLEALAVRLAPFLPKTESAALTPGAPTGRTSPFATITEAAAYLNVTRRAVEAHLATGRLTHVKHGMPASTPRSKWRNWPTRIAWTELEAFARGEPTGPLAAAAQRARALTNGHAA